MSKTYQELLKDPRWQRKRLEIMQEHQFECEECRESTSTLHIHHGYYEKNKKPWDYENSTLHCLCDACHENRAYWEAIARKMIATLSVEDIAKAVDSWVTLQDVF